MPYHKLNATVPRTKKILTYRQLKANKNIKTEIYKLVTTESWEGWLQKGQTQKCIHMSEVTWPHYKQTASTVGATGWAQQAGYVSHLVWHKQFKDHLCFTSIIPTLKNCSETEGAGYFYCSINISWYAIIFLLQFHCTYTTENTNAALLNFSCCQSILYVKIAETLQITFRAARITQEAGSKDRICAGIYGCW